MLSNDNKDAQSRKDENRDDFDSAVPDAEVYELLNDAIHACYDIFYDGNPFSFTRVSFILFKNDMLLTYKEIKLKFISS